jgi:aspartate racemase
MTRHIGIAAVSAEGAALCYRTICAEGAELLGPHAHPEVTMHTVPLSEYMRPVSAGDWVAASQLLAASAAKLVGAGAQLLICPDNTLHPAVDRIRDESPVPWLHIAEEVATVACQRGFQCLGVLGTRSLMEGNVYPRKLGPLGIRHVIPNPQERALIDATIFDELVYGRLETRARESFRSIIRGLARRGCDAVVLGCTEIPLLISEKDSDLPTLDSTRILARAALRHAAGSP